MRKKWATMPGPVRERESDVAVLGKAESAHDDPSLRTPKLKKSNSGNQYRYTVLLSSFISIRLYQYD